MRHETGNETMEGGTMTKYQEIFAKHDGKYVLVDGRKCRINVRFFNAIYPYKHIAMQAYAMPLDKQDPIYDLEHEFGQDSNRIRKYDGVVFAF